MLKGKGAVVYTILKIALYAVGYIEYLSFYRSDNRMTEIILVSILVVNSFFRQFYFYEKDNLHKYGRVSIILEFALAAYIASLQPVYAVILFLTPTIFESVAAHSLAFGVSASAVSLIALLTIDVLSQVWIYNYFEFFRNSFVAYGLGFILILATSYLAGLQFRERERTAKINRELEHAYKQLMDSSSELQELSVTKERTRMAREIHDTLAHTLTAVVVQMEACKKLIDLDVPRAKIEIEKAQELTRAGLGDVKRTIKALRPQILENSSLLGALKKLAQDIEENTDVKVNLHESLLGEKGLSSSAEVALFRVIQESITNAIRHGGAGQVDISMIEMDGMVNIDITDNGTGCAHIKEGYGLKGITERIKGLGGTVSFSSDSGKGFRTQIDIHFKGMSPENRTAAGETD